MEEGGRIGVVGWAMKPEMTAQLVIIPASRDVCFRVEAKFASMADMRRIVLKKYGPPEGMPLK
jgi:hypothetical protein